MLIAEKRIPVEIEGKKYTLVFDVNTMCAYEEATNQFFLATCSEMFDLIFPEGSTNTEARINPGDLIKKFSMVKLRALLWSAMHEYDKNDNPVWPLTINQVGKLLSIHNIVPLFRDFLRGNAANQPSKQVLGESQADVPEKMQDDPPSPTPMSGGDRSFELPVSAFASTSEKSAD